MAANIDNPYLRTKVLTASPAELRVMLVEGAIRFCRQGRDGIAAKNHEETFNGLSQAKAIIMELINALRPEVDRNLCDKLSGLYTYMYTRLIEANLEKSVDLVDEVVRLLEYERDTWRMVVEKLAAERAPVAAAATHSDPPESAGSFNLEG